MTLPTTATTQPALRTTATVLPGHRIEIQLPTEAIVGEEVEVFVVLPKEPELKPQPEEEPKQNDILEIIAEGRRHRIGMTAEQVDEYLRIERESWER